jgi:hypothetical protein
MKRILFAFFLAGLAAAALASPNDDQYVTSDQSASGGSTSSLSAPNAEGSPWAQDHHFTAPPQ